MSISGSMSSALSGLNAAARSAELISSNIANALTEGYGRRELQLGARRVGNTGQGVQINGVAREVNQVLVGDRRIAQAGAADRDGRANFLLRVERALGSPDSAASLSGRIAAFDAALIAAAARPESDARLSGVADAARALSQSFHDISGEIQTARSAADARINADVVEVNRALATIADLNTHITTLASGGRDSSALIDQRQQLIDRIATIVPIREVPRENGRVALFTTGGAVLLEGKPAVLGFTPTGLITPDMTLGSGALSGLTINGRPARTDTGGTMAGGNLAANFAIRDQLATGAQADLDAVARDLVTRFQDPGLDLTRAPGTPGLFTDGGAAFSPANEEGLAARLGLNALADPAQGGAAWRLRDGLGATSPGPVGQSTLLTALRTALIDARPTTSGSYSAGNRSLSGLATQLHSNIASSRLGQETEASFAAARATALHTLELEGGVDTDRELQDLLLIEKAYAANAKVIQSADEMIQILLGM